MVNIGAYVSETAWQPAQPGRDDCALWCADLVYQATGYDPAADLRGAYSTWFECRQIVMRAGGLLNLIAPRMDHAALIALASDGVAVARVDDVAVCGIVQAGRLIVRRRGGGVVIKDRPEILRGWSWSKF